MPAAAAAAAASSAAGALGNIAGDEDPFDLGRLPAVEEEAPATRRILFEGEHAAPPEPLAPPNRIRAFQVPWVHERVAPPPHIPPLPRGAARLAGAAQGALLKLLEDEWSAEHPAGFFKGERELQEEIAGQLAEAPPYPLALAGLAQPRLRLRTAPGSSRRSRLLRLQARALGRPDAGKGTGSGLGATRLGASLSAPSLRAHLPPLGDPEPRYARPTASYAERLRPLPGFEPPPAPVYSPPPFRYPRADSPPRRAESPSASRTRGSPAPSQSFLAPSPSPGRRALASPAPTSPGGLGRRPAARSASPGPPPAADFSMTGGGGGGGGGSGGGGGGGGAVERRRHSSGGLHAHQQHHNVLLRDVHATDERGKASVRAEFIWRMADALRVRDEALFLAIYDQIPPSFSGGELAEMKRVARVQSGMEEDDQADAVLWAAANRGSPNAKSPPHHRHGRVRSRRASQADRHGHGTGAGHESRRASLLTAGPQLDAPSRRSSVASLRR
eukprot:tig00020554_g10899.t1